MIIFGVDTGLTGAVAAITHDGRALDVIDLPTWEQGTLKLIDGMELHLGVRELHLLGDSPVVPRVYMEMTSARPGLHANACHSMGRTLGGCASVFSILGWPMEFTPPSQWKKAMKVQKDQTDSGLCIARQLFPNIDLRLKKHHNRADALLIAEWGRRQAKTLGYF